MLSCILLSTDRDDLAGPAERIARERFIIRHASRHPRAAQAVPAAASEAAASGEVDLLLNFLAPMIVPGRMLAAIRRTAINIHPGPPEWPGIGSASYALFNGDATFGVTAHRMTTQVDAGEIVSVDRFPIRPDDTCDTLFERALQRSVAVFEQVCNRLTHGALAPSGDVWSRRAITRAQFERWMELSPHDPQDVIARKVRALKHPRLPGPFFVIDGVRVPVDEATLAPQASTGAPGTGKGTGP